MEAAEGAVEEAPMRAVEETPMEAVEEVVADAPIETVEEAPRVRHALVAGGLVVLGNGIFVGLLLLAGLVGGWRPGPGPLILIILGGLTAVSLTMVGLVVRRSRGLTLRALGFRRPTWRLLHLLWQIPVTFIVAAAASGLILTTFFDGGDTGSVGGMSQHIDDLGGGVLPILALWVLAAVLTPLWEEVLFRGILFQALAGRMPWFLAALLGAAVFAAIHIAPPALAYVFVLGLSCCLLLRFHGNLWAPIILHAVNNSVVVLGAVAALGAASA
jgi:membrane protease YdiL (CAAX protease family)